MAFLKKPLLLGLIVGIPLLLAGGAFFVFPELTAFLPWSGGQDATAEEKKTDEPKKDISADLEPFAVNLAGPGFSRYARLSLRLQLNEEHDKEVLKQSAAKVRDALIMLLTSKRAEELITPEGKIELRKEIIEQVNIATGKPIVSAIYFKEFLIQ
jgi:flagellar FliL protein